MNHIKKHTPTKKKSTTTANLKKHRRVPHQQHGAAFSTTATTTTRNIRTASRNKRCVQDAVDMVNEYTQWKRNKASQRDPFVFQSREMTIDHAFTPPGKATATHLHPHHHHDINRHVGRGATTVVDTMKHLTHHLYPQPQRIIPHHHHPTNNNNNNNRHNTLFHTAFHPTRAVWAPQKRNTTASGVSGSSVFDESFINMNNEHQRDQTLSFKQHEPLSENGLENYQAASTFNANIYAAETKPSFHSRELTNNGGERNMNNNNNNNTNQNNTNMTSSTNNNNNSNKNDTTNQRQQRQTKQSTTTSTSSRTSRRATKNNENNTNNTNKDNTATMNTKQQAVGGNDTMGQNADHFAI